MIPKKRLCRGWKLYVITDRSRYGARSLEETVREAVKGGASVIQLRDKEASDRALTEQAEGLLKITRPAAVALVINDRLGVAKAAGADGVHLGQDDAGLIEARRLLGSSAIIGRSAYNLEQALLAQKEGFDYVGIGPVYGTPIKPELSAAGLGLVRLAASRLRVPFVALGGIDETTIGDVVRAGAVTVAVVRAVMQAPDPRAATKDLVRQIISCRLQRSRHE